MKMKFVVALVCMFVLVVGAFAQGGEEQDVRFKSGEIAFTILESDGVTPVDGTEVKIRRSPRSKPFAEAVTDKQGNASIAIEAGDYVLNVAGRNIASLIVADDAVLSVCRVVLDDDKAAALLAGGAAAGTAVGTGAGAAALGAGTFKTIVVGGVAVMVAVGGGYAIYEHNDDDDEDSTPPAPPPSPEADSETSSSPTLDPVVVTPSPVVPVSRPRDRPTSPI